MTKTLLLAAAFASLAAAQAPGITGIVNAASYYPGAGVAPGSIVSIFGTNLFSIPNSPGVPIPGIVAVFSGIPTMPLFYLSSNQINTQVPWTVPLGPSNVVVFNGAGSSASATVQIVQAQPGIFTVGANGIGQAIATDNSTGATADSSTPIQAGSYLVIWCTGLGAVDAAGNTLATPIVTIGGVRATLIYSLLSPQFAGEYQVAVQVPPTTPTGNAVPLQIQIAGATSLGNVTIAVAGPAPAFQTPSTTCTLTSTACTEIDLSATDPFSTSGAFAGYADATIRQDPLTGTLWMAYSWPHTIPSGKAGVGGTQVLDTHVSYSTDGGKTWTYKGALYTSQPVLDPVTGQSDYTANEVMNLYPEVVNGVTYWYGIHSTYIVPQASPGGPSSAPYSKRWAIAMAPGTAADGPMALASATLQYLGEPDDTYPQYFPLSVDLAALDPEVNGCTTFYEPALIMSGSDLYLFLACTPNNVANRFYAVFKTSDPLDNAPNWTWNYVQQGPVKFANEKDAMSIGRYFSTGTTYITQMDLAPGRNPGILVAIMSATFDNANGKNSMGCVAAELAGINPPRFVYNAQGQVQVDAFITSPDSQNTGPGSCTYSPFSATGMILAHRQSTKAPQNGGFFTFLMQSLLFP